MMTIGVRETMNKKVIGLALVAVLLAFGFPAEAQQSKKLPLIGFLDSGTPSSSQAVSRHSAKGCGISVISRGKASWLSIATLRERTNVFQALWPNSCNS